MSERETTTLQTPSGKEIKIKTYITARERNALRAVFLEKIKMDPANAMQPTLAGLDGATLEKAERVAIEIAVTSYDGSTENIADRLLDNPAGPADYDFVAVEANKIANLGPAK